MTTTAIASMTTMAVVVAVLGIIEWIAKLAVQPKPPATQPIPAEPEPERGGKPD